MASRTTRGTLTRKIQIMKQIIKYPHKPIELKYENPLIALINTFAKIGKSNGEWINERLKEANNNDG